jgi:hypothetical protein
MLRSGLLSSFVSCLVLAGCHHADRACPTCGRAQLAMTMPPRTAVAAAPVSPYAGQLPGPVFHEVAKTAPASTTARDSGSLDNKEWQLVSGDMHDKLTRRRTFTDLTVNPAFAHAPDYSWLVGELRSMGPDVWTVRFASVDEDVDTVVLVDAPAINNLKNGDLVRVEGQLVDPTTHESKAPYRVTAIRTAEHN